jgi:ferrochelatase
LKNVKPVCHKKVIFLFKRVIKRCCAYLCETPVVALQHFFNIPFMALKAEKALLLLNLGTPDSPSVRDVRSYLNEFLMDSRVLDFPAVFRFLLVRGIIAPFRSPHSAKAYQRVWQKEGSPIIISAQQLCKSIREKVDFPVKIAMRYKNPSPKAAFDALLKENPGLKEVTVFPLYPHYTMSSYETSVVYAKKVHRKSGYPFKLNFISPFYDHPGYIAAMAKSIAPFLNREFDKILFSYHGLPERHLRKDEVSRKRAAARPEQDFRFPSLTYQEQCKKTTVLVGEALGLAPGKVETAFQSRLSQAGKEWIKPYTAARLQELPQEGVKKLLVVCPAFVNDCLETLEEIAVEGKHTFETAGGESFHYIPCLNANEEWVKTVIQLTMDN